MHTKDEHPEPEAAAGTHHSTDRESDLDARMSIFLAVNGKAYPLRVDPRTTLLDALQEHLHLTGTKNGCDHGQCGACTVLRDGRRINACLIFAVAAQHCLITTIEGLVSEEELHPVQQAFIAADTLPCGFCTPRETLSDMNFLRETWEPGDTGIRAGMAGTLCRCGSYPQIAAAVCGLRNQGYA